jgi:Ca2+-dependent lipid-binding protein
MRLEVWDKDVSYKTSDDMGHCVIDLTKVIQNPGKWVIDQNYPLQGPNDKDILKKFNYFGEIYIQMRFLPKGETNDGTFPTPTENLEEVIIASTHKGEFILRLVHANIYPQPDNSSVERKKSNPYVSIIFPDKTEKTSLVMKNKLKPIWKEEIKQKLNIVATVMSV